MSDEVSTPTNATAENPEISENTGDQTSASNDRGGANTVEESLDSPQVAHEGLSGDATESHTNGEPDDPSGQVGGDRTADIGSPPLSRQSSQKIAHEEAAPTDSASLFSQIQQQAFSNPTVAAPVHIERPAMISLVHTAIASVPSLLEIAVRVVVANFAERPVIDPIPKRAMDKIVNILPTNAPLEITSQVIEDEIYWKRCSVERWKTCDITQHGSSWKRLFMERNLAETLESYDSKNDEDGEVMLNLIKLMKLSGKFVGNLVLKQMLCHLDLKKIFENLPHLLTLGLTYCKRNVGMEFEWSMFGISLEDSASLAQCLRHSVSAGGNLSTLILSHNMIDDDKLRVIATGLLDNPTLTQIDLSHNKIGDRGARALAKVLDSPSCVITHMYLQDNVIHQVGAKALGQALKHNLSLMTLNLRLNHLGDEGGKFVFEGLKSNCTLQLLNMSSNQLGLMTATAFSGLPGADVALSTIDLSCNNFGQEGGKLIRDFMETNKTITSFDVRQCQVGLDLECIITNQASKNNEDLRRKEKKRT